jgi:hypothetical protein
MKTEQEIREAIEHLRQARSAYGPSPSGECYVQAVSFLFMEEGLLWALGENPDYDRLFANLTEYDRIYANERN